jgi:aminopeptidase N
MRLIRKLAATTVLFITLLNGQAGIPDYPHNPSSGGQLLAEQANYDVKHYALDLAVNPVDSSVTGTMVIDADLQPGATIIAVDLDTAFTVSETAWLTAGGEPIAAEYTHVNGRIWITVPDQLSRGGSMQIRVGYSGRPRIAKRPPWDGGFTWEYTESGEPWIGVSCQGEGADIWWPCKDHPSDKPDSMTLNLTVPEGLIAVSNGKSHGSTKNGDGTETFHWFVSTQIANYTVTLNIAPYRTVTANFTSIAGDEMVNTFWVLPENYDQGVEIMPLFMQHLRVLEELFGPYPFRRDKYGIAEAPYLGMEHQTLIAYGNKYRKDEFGDDWLHLHELAHEWWANLVTCPDWNDIWIHEGFGRYSEALYLERVYGDSAYNRHMEISREGIKNGKPISTREPMTADQAFSLPPDWTVGDGDMYTKGAYILHTLRYVLGDDNFFKILRLTTYPDHVHEQDAGADFHTHFVTSDDFISLAESVSGKELGWFFDIYLWQPELPVLKTKFGTKKLSMKWITPGKLPFDMPVVVSVDGESRQVDFKNGKAKLAYPKGSIVIVDPEKKVLKAN